MACPGRTYSTHLDSLLQFAGPGVCCCCTSGTEWDVAASYIILTKKQLCSPTLPVCAALLSILVLVFQGLPNHPAQVAYCRAPAEVHPGDPCGHSTKPDGVRVVVQPKHVYQPNLNHWAANSRQHRHAKPWNSAVKAVPVHQGVAEQHSVQQWHRAVCQAFAQQGLFQNPARPVLYHKQADAQQYPGPGGLPKSHTDRGSATIAS